MALIEKLSYFKVNANVIEAKCKGITFVFTTLNNTDQIIGTLFAKNNDPLALRIKELNGKVHSLLTPVDIYPSLGLITYAGNLIVSDHLDCDKIGYFYSYEFFNKSGTLNKFCFGTLTAASDISSEAVLADLGETHAKDYPDTELKITAFNKI